MKPNIVVIGSSNTDMVINVDHFPVGGETIPGKKFITVQGGKGANQAVSARRLGANVALVCRLGMDAFGDESFKAYQSEGIDTRFIVRDADEYSGVALIMVNKNAENVIAVVANANARLSPEDVYAAQDVIRTADCVLLQLEIPMETVEAAVNLAHSHNVRVIFNPAPCAPLSPALLARVDTLTPNETECALLAEQFGLPLTEDNYLELYEKLNLRHLVVTQGKKGALVVSGGVLRQIPGYKVDAVDTTAAGDTFSGALANALAQGVDIFEAVRYANAAAAISTTRSGAQTSMPDAEAVQAFINFMQEERKP